MRDDFSLPTKELLAKRVAYRCSNPACRHVTSGPQTDTTKAVNIGVAAHITAASEGGPRFDPAMTSDDRQGTGNGIWLCQSCAKLVDNDPIRYAVDVLQLWKRLAETTAIHELESHSGVGEDSTDKCAELESVMPDMFSEMRNDLAANHLSREFVILKKTWVYNGRPEHPVLVYYFEDHPDLESKLLILQNRGLIREITYNNVSRYVISEELARYLTRR
ncbi:hypothetical protein Dehly_1176 [Dehalogenimonas lykanthroporepellens BL-DC-9]|nr:hypothetical protein Dehly_1176 [Dehalogenimonas lykanthroporepellens BL-DC-9]